MSNYIKAYFIVLVMADEYFTLACHELIPKPKWIISHQARSSEVMSIGLSSEVSGPLVIHESTGFCIILYMFSYAYFKS